MTEPRFVRIEESVVFNWIWPGTSGLLVISGGCGGGGGGGGAFCLEGLNFYGALGGQGGEGGEPTLVKRSGELFLSAGGNGGAGGSAGGLKEGIPVNGEPGRGCHYGNSGDGGNGATHPKEDGRIVSSGGDGGKGFPGEVQVFEIHDVSLDEQFEITVGKGGKGGSGGIGFEDGSAGNDGMNGFVLFVPLAFNLDGDS